MKARTNIKTVLKNNWILTIIILVNLIITLYLSIHLNIWIDEAYSLHTTSKDLNYAFWQALNFESQAPLYFILLKLWRMIDPSIIFARLFSVLCISAMIYFSAFAAKKYMNNRYYLLVTAAAAFNPFTIWAATEIRMYAFILLLSVLIMILFHYAYLTGLAKKRYRILYIILAVISLYTQYYMGFLLAANAAILLFYGRWNDLKKYIADMLIPVLSLLLLYPILFIQMNTHAVYNKNDTLDELLPGVRYITLRVIDYIFSIDEYSFSQLIRWIIRLVFIILLYFTVKKYFKRILWLVKRNYHFTLPAVMVMLSMFAVAYLWLGQISYKKNIPLFYFSPQF